MSRVPSTASVDAPSLRDRLGAGSAPQLVDVRSPAEFEAGHIPGAVNVPLDMLRGRLDELCQVLQDQEIVLVCQSGQRAGQAREALQRAGHPGGAVLAGGIGDWTAVGGDLRRGRQVWALERQVRFTAGALVLTGVVGSVLAPPLKWLAAGIGGGLVVAAVTDTCAMGAVLARMPWNRRGAPSPDLAIARLQQQAG
jgi:rhodanese-related sulfurtransferase